jgi:hypothetical protein
VKHHGPASVVLPDDHAFKLRRRDLPRLAIGMAGLAVLALALPAGTTGAAPGPSKLRGVLVTATQAGAPALRQWKAEGNHAVVLSLSEDAPAKALRAAARRIRAAGLDLHYWIEIGRCPSLADAHPEWMASLQGHTEWRRHFPQAPTPAAGEVVKNYPWVPVRYREAFDAHLQRVAALLQGMPPARGLFLNDLQAAPSACGCGNVLCRWTPDYGPIRTATRLSADAAARFVAAVAERAPGTPILPVWTPECEEPDMAKDGACAGVGCFRGDCWYEYTAQLTPLARRCPTLAALLPYRALGRDLPRYGPTAGWVARALRSFAEMPPQRRGQAIPADRVIAVLQGWDVTLVERDAQIQRAEEAGAAGTVLALMKIEQGWEPRIVRVSQAKER